ncbi:MAG: hypothetical protein ACK4IY_07475, partial [Chitinophagales bacterium]
MRIITFHIILLCVLIQPTQVYTQDLILKAYTDSNTYLIGDYIRFDLEVQTSESNRFTWPELDSIAPGMEFISVSGIDSSKQNNLLSLHQQIVLSVY